jgi:phosphatidylserine decarboxylase
LEQILKNTKEGDIMQQGERYGIIRFGSRCDIYIPLHYDLLIEKGQIAIGGETILAANKAVFSADKLTWKKL